MIFYTYYIPGTQIKSLFFEGTSIPTPLKQGLWNSNQNRGPHLGNPGISYINCHTLRGPGVSKFDSKSLRMPQRDFHGIKEQLPTVWCTNMDEIFGPRKTGGGFFRLIFFPEFGELTKIQVVVLFLTAFLWFFRGFSIFELSDGKVGYKDLERRAFCGAASFWGTFWVRFWENLPKTRFGKFTGSGVFFCIFVIFLFHAEQKHTPQNSHVLWKGAIFKRKGTIFQLPTIDF